jgi:putative transcriptional regulator
MSTPLGYLRRCCGVGKPTVPSEAFDAIAAGLEDAIAYAEGYESRGIASRHATEQLGVAAVRRKTQLSQAEFARTFGVSKATLVKWEQGQRRPTGAARVLLRVIDRNPKAVLEAFAA